MDLLLAAHAVTLDAVLVTNNVSEFERVPRLKVKKGQELGESVRRTVYPFCLRLAWTTASRSRPS
jgi:hypothetical protein